ncbi:GL19311 [Drosophila persimilis]|uniref:GL19311 n=1 Tax=Drosophila persimilis TaxID=7234 RepID=B4G8K0_DROPE|nr:GL19311 [Drosophila persimilis]
MNNFIEPSAASPSIGDAGRITMQNISSSSDQFLVPNFEKRSSIAATHLPLPLQHFFPVSPVVPPSVVTAVGPEVDSPQPSRSRMAQMEIYWNGIASVNNKMTMDITKTEPGLVGLSSNQQQQHSRQQQQAASMNSNSGNNVGQNTNNGCNSNGGGVNSGNGNGKGNNNSLSNVQSIAAAANNNNNNNNGSLLCAGCGKHIKDRYFLRALDMLWHQDCLKCGCCDCRLGEVGSTLYKTGNLMLCKLDYYRLFGNTGYCAACSKVIFAFQMVMRARTNVYHLHCFACQQCNYRLCVGDRFYLCMNKILCEYDYEEWLLFATIAAGVPGAADELPGGGPGVANMGVAVGMVNGPCTPGDHNNNKGPQTPTGGDSPFAAAATAAAEEPARGVQTKKSPGHGRA